MLKHVGMEMSKKRGESEMQSDRIYGIRLKRDGDEGDAWLSVIGVYLSVWI